MAFDKSTAFDYLRKADAAGRMAHAYLITGPSGSGKRELCEALCLLVAGPKASTGNPLANPDVHIAEPESKSRRITIDKMRAIEADLHMKASGAGRKVAIIFDADRMMHQAANAFLKTLEEPPANSLLLLVTAYPELLLETVLSRCIRVPLRATTERPVDRSETALLDALESAGPGDPPNEHAILQLAGRILTILAAEHEAAREDADAALKVESDHFKQRTGDDKWIAAREDALKAWGESCYLHRRATLLDVIAAWFADGLRQRFGEFAMEFPDRAHATAAAVGHLEAGEVSRRVERLQILRDHLDRTINEHLAIEAAVMDIFLPPHATQV